MATKAKHRRSSSVEWRLAIREPIEAFDEYTGVTIELSPGQADPGSIEGLIIDFRYIAADGEITRRSLLCWQCGRVGQRIYVRGYCSFREELRTFRIDRMHDVVAFQNDREITVDRLKEFFSAFAADHPHEESELLRLTTDDG
jgi:hypothetical protein